MKTEMINRKYANFEDTTNKLRRAEMLAWVLFIGIGITYIIMSIFVAV